MRCIRTLIAGGVLALSCAAAGAQGVTKIPGSLDAALIPNYKLIHPGLAAAGQPSPEALGKLKEYGFRTVINLRTAEEGAPAEAEAVKPLGLAYLWVPITPDSFSLKDVAAVGAVLGDTGAGPVLLHCASSNRVGGVLAVLAVQEGKSLEEALSAGRAAGLKSPEMIEAVRRVAAQVPARP